MRKIIIILLGVVLTVVVSFYLYWRLYVGVDLLKIGSTVLIEDVYEYNKEIDVNQTIFHKIRPAFYSEIGRGNFPKVILYKNNKKLVLGNCYKQLPYIIEKHDSLCNLVTDKTSLFDKQQIPISDEFKKFTTMDGRFPNKKTLKKYNLIYYYGLWSKGLNKKKLLPLINRYKNTDSIALFIVNCDTIAQIK